jgi:hypothetical protein
MTAAGPALSEAPAQAALPAGVRLLCVAEVEPSWVGLTLQLDALGGVSPFIKWLSRPADVLRLLRDETFDCVVLGPDLPDPAALVRGIRASGGDDPIVLLVPRPNDELWLEVATEDVEIVTSPGGWQSRVLGTAVGRAVDRSEVRRERQLLAAADRRRLMRERDEAEHLLHQQRLILEQLHLATGLPEPVPEPEPVLPELSEELDHYYQELLRTYVIMGSGSLGPEIAKLASLFCAMNIGPRDALQLHLYRVERLVQGLGNRSTRHVMARADLLALEMMIHLAEGYQRQGLSR